MFKTQYTSLKGPGILDVTAQTFDENYKTYAQLSDQQNQPSIQYYFDPYYTEGFVNSNYGQTVWPRSIAVDDDIVVIGYPFAAQSNSTSSGMVKIFKPYIQTGINEIASIQCTFSNTNNSNQRFAFGYAVAVGNNRVAIIEKSNDFSYLNRVHIYDTTGNFIAYADLNTARQNPTTFYDSDNIYNINDVVIADNKIFVRGAEFFNFYYGAWRFVYIFNLNGQYINKIKISGGDSNFTNCKMVAKYNKIFIPFNNKVVIYDTNGNFINKIESTDYFHRIAVGHGKIVILTFRSGVPVLLLYDLNANLLKEYEIVSNYNLINLNPTADIYQGFEGGFVGIDIAIYRGLIFCLAKGEYYQSTSTLFIFDMDLNPIETSSTGWFSQIFPWFTSYSSYYPAIFMCSDGKTFCITTRTHIPDSFTNFYVATKRPITSTPLPFVSDFLELNNY